MIQSSRVTVGTSPTRLDLVSPVDAGNNYDQSCAGRNRGTVSIFLGGPTVAATDGYEVEAGAAFVWDLTASDKLYAVVATGTAVVHIAQSGL